jgi:hypothetical protein
MADTRIRPRHAADSPGGLIAVVPRAADRPGYQRLQSPGRSTRECTGPASQLAGLRNPLVEPADDVIIERRPVPAVRHSRGKSRRQVFSRTSASPLVRWQRAASRVIPRSPNPTWRLPATRRGPSLALQSGWCPRPRACDREGPRGSSRWRRCVLVSLAERRSRVRF